MNNANLITYFAKHKVAANILMILLLISGLWAISKLNTQFLPNFILDVINVSVQWPGASALDVEQAITIPIEQELKSLNHVKEINSTSSEGFASFSIEYHEGTDIGQALDDVKQQIALVRNLPQDSRSPEISKVERFENIARVIIYGPSSLEQLRPLANEFKRQLLAKGIAKINLVGLPEKEIAIQIPSSQIFSVNQSLVDISQQIGQASQTLPAGTAGRDELGHAVKSPGKSQTPYEFSKITLDTAQKRLEVSQLANIQERPQDREVEIFFRGKPAVELSLLRTETADSLKSAQILDKWLQEIKPTLGESLQIQVYDESWKYIFGRISLLVKNGLGGLLLILITLYLFLEKRIAFWVAVGIPVSFAGALAVLYISGGSINMVSLFALIMTLGIIVDDTIVVGENAYARMQQNTSADKSAILAAHKMLPPVLASSLTTMAAFLPLMLIGGTIGNILFDIPFVVICVITVSVLECFLILPGHITHSFKRFQNKKNKPPASNLRQIIDTKFNQFRDGKYKSILNWIINNRATTISAAVAILILVFMLPLTGRVGFQFFPTPDSGIIKSHIQFIAGTPQEKVIGFIKQVEDALFATEAEYKQKEQQEILISAVTYLNSGADGGNRKSSGGHHIGSITIELVSPDEREVTNQEFINDWRKKITIPPGLEKFTIFTRRGGPPGNDIDIDLIGKDTKQLKNAATELEEHLHSYTGVFNIQDNLPYGKPELIYKLTPQAETIGLTYASLGRQLRAALDGNIVQIINDEEDEVEVRVVLPEEERNSLAILSLLPISTPQGDMVPLGTVVTFYQQKGLASLQHIDGRLTTRVSAEVDSSIIKANSVISNLQKEFLPLLMQKYSIEYALKGRSEDQAETFSDMKKGMMLAIGLIYLILAWVFASYSWPLTVMAILPFGITGAIFGHWVMGIDLTLLSFFGIFGLSGIVVNDSIILVSFYRDLRLQGIKMKHAVVMASCQRLRAVILTSLTTIAGLLPLLFETSLQAQFLIPMAVSITFGLAFATFLVLFLVPILLYQEEKIKVSFKLHKRNSAKRRSSLIVQNS